MIEKNIDWLPIVSNRPTRRAPCEVSPEARAGHVLLIDMPFRKVHAGSLGLSTLKAILERAGIHTTVEYLCVKLARIIGLDWYRVFAGLSDVRYSGEILFTPHFYGLSAPEFVDNELKAQFETLWKYPEQMATLGAFVTPESLFLAAQQACVEQVPAFLDSVMRDTDWAPYDIIGFSLMFDQTLPSLALAQRIKARFPEKLIVFGGAGCDGGMGGELLRSFPFLDLVCIGEADLTLAPLVCAIRDRAPLDEVPGIAYRSGREIKVTPSPRLIEDLDALPIPDYTDYFSAIEGMEVTPILYFESSRGCWWGQKHLCTFCGLNANGLTYRRKSAERTVAEILELSERHRGVGLGAADNILDVSFFKTVFPELIKAAETHPDRPRLELFYEMKSNIKKPQLETARRAGVGMVQPGIESFSDRILRLMDKGATGIQQMQFLKWATELDIQVVYGVLYSNPGEDAGDYVEMSEKVAFMTHLAPPSYVAPISLDRFSPYFKEPERFGIRNMRPHPSYAQTFPDPNLNLPELAYRFAYDHDDQNNRLLAQTTEACLTEIRKWQRAFKPDTLMYDTGDDSVWILDCRFEKPVMSALTGIQAQIFLYCDEIHSFENILSRFPRAGRGPLRDFLNMLYQRRWVYRDSGDHYLAMPVRRKLKSLVARKNRREPAGAALTA